MKEKIIRTKKDTQKVLRIVLEEFSNEMDFYWVHSQNQTSINKHEKSSETHTHIGVCAIFSSRDDETLFLIYCLFFLLPAGELLCW